MRVNVENLNQGMVLNQNVFLENGVLLIPKGTQLTESLIMKLLEHYIFQVEIKDTWKQDNDFVNFDNTYNHALSKVKKSFETIKHEHKFDVSDFQSVVEDLLDRTDLGRNILTYMKLIERKDDYTLQHSINVSITSMLMGKWLKYSEKEIKLLGIGAVLHDIGKVMIPNNILNKPDRLSVMEYSIMKNHSKLGYDLLKNSGVLDETIINIVLTHHERVDGKGYPFGIKGNKISDKAKIVSICDVYDAVTSKRVYKPKQNPLNGLKAIFDDSYNGLDPYLCRVFLDNVAMAYYGSKALLNNGSVGKIIKIIPDNPSRPWVAVNDDLYNLEVDKNIQIIDII